MKRIILIIGIILFSSAAVFGAGVLEGRLSSEESSTGSSVWQVSKNGNILFLGGSIHILRASDYPLPEEFEYAFSKSEIQVLEADSEQLTDPEILQYLLSKMILPGETTIQSLLDPAVYNLLSMACYEYGFSINDVAKIKPAMVVNMLLIQQMEKIGFKQQGIDDYFRVKAKNKNKPIIFLESVQSQINMLVSMGEGYENEYVSYSLTDMEETEEDIETLLHEWKYGITGTNEESLIEMKNEWPEIYKVLITDRHDEWIPQIEEFIASGKVHFVVAGLLHMYGPDGLRSRLKDLGYTVEQVIIK